jgi:hypothetical protein
VPFTVLPNGRNAFVTSTGAPAAGYKVYTYVAGTSTPKDTYTSYTGGSANTNPVVLDSRGEAAIYWTGSYDVVLKDAAGSVVWGPERLVEPEASGAAATLDTALLASLSASSGSSLIGFLQSGSGAVARTAQNKMRDLISVKDFGAVGDGSTNDYTAIAAAITYAKSVGGTVYFPFTANGYKYGTSLTLSDGCRLEGQGVPNRWRSTQSSVKLKYTGSASAIDLSPGAATGVDGVQIANLEINGASATGTANGLYLNATAATSYIEGVYCENTSFVDFPGHQVFSDGTVFDIIFKRCTIMNPTVAALDCVYIQNGSPSQWTFDDCWISPYTAGKWGVYTLSVNQDVRFLGGTVAPYNGAAGANGVFVSGGLFIYGTHFEGALAAQTGTIGIQYKGSNGAFISPSSCTYFGTGIKIGDSGADAARGWVISGNIGNYNAGGTGDVEITAGGIRAGVILGLGYSNGTPTVTDTRLSGDGVPEVVKLYRGALETVQLVNKRYDVAYSGSMTINAASGNEFDITASNGSAFTINAPTGMFDGQRITITLRNTSGGALGAATWNAVFKMSAWTNPATGFSRSIDFKYNGTNWVQVSQTGVDVAN